jgi:hypothetical protein
MQFMCRLGRVINPTCTLFIACVLGLLSASCLAVPTEDGVEVIVVQAPAAPSPESTAIAESPRFLEDRLAVPLCEPFVLLDGQTAYIESEDLTLHYFVDIEWECPEPTYACDENGTGNSCSEEPVVVECEVPLIATAYYEALQDGEYLGQVPWQREIAVGDYMIPTLEMYSGYDYKTHRFEITVMVVPKRLSPACRGGG